MNSGTGRKIPISVVLDTNILISAVIYKGKPEEIVDLIFKKEIEAITSTPLLAELSRILAEKFLWNDLAIYSLQEKLRLNFRVVYPSESVSIIRDEPDNRVLEAGIEGQCDFIITGDKEILALKTHKKIKIFTPTDFLEALKNPSKV